MIRTESYKQTGPNSGKSETTEQSFRAGPASLADAKVGNSLQKSRLLSFRFFYSIFVILTHSVLKSQHIFYVCLTNIMCIFFEYLFI